MKKLKFRHKIGNILHFIRLLETRNHDVSAQTPGVNGQKLLFFCKIPGVNKQKLRDSDKTPGVNEQKSHDSDKTPGVNDRKLRDSDKTPGDNDRKSCDSDKTPGDNCSFSRNSAQERGRIIRFREILLRNGVQSSDFVKFCSGTGYNYQIS